ncbi:Leucine-rich repeat-containing protein 36 [Manis javanica]|nr:Leucine-rich repeat-containing protein 36 [Manis javanica]
MVTAPKDERAVRESERKAAKLHFSQLGNSENFRLEVEKSSREKTMKNCGTDESSASKVKADVDNRIETEIIAKSNIMKHLPCVFF